MPILNTYHDKINRATGADSDIPWEELDNEQKEKLIDDIFNNKNQVKPITSVYECIGQQNNSKIFTILNYNFTLTELMQLTSILLQLIAIIITITISKKIK